MKKAAFITFSLLSSLLTFAQYEGTIDAKAKFPFTALLPEQYIRNPRISADGSQVLFIQETGTESHISLTATTAANGGKALVSYPSECIDQLEWLDDTRFIISVDENHDGNFDIIQCTTENPEKKTRISNGQDSRIVSMFKETPRAFSYVQFNPSTSTYDLIYFVPDKNLTTTILSELPTEASHLICDPSGKKALFSTQGKEGQELFYKNIYTGEVLMVTKTNGTDRVLPIRFSQNGESVYALSNLNREVFALVEIDLTSGKEITVVSKNSLTDIKNIGFSSLNGAPLYSTSLTNGVLKGEGYTPTLSNLFNTGAPIVGSNFEIESFSENEKIFILRKINITSTYQYIVFDATNKTKLEPFGAPSTSLPKDVIAKTSLFHFTLADGTAVNGFINLPKGSTSSPMVVLLNEYNHDFTDNQLCPEVQNLCQQNRAVLRISIPSTIGMGKSYLNSESILNEKWFIEMIDAASARLKTEFNFVPQSLSLYTGTYSTPYALNEIISKSKLFRTTVIQNIPNWIDHNGICYREYLWNAYGQCSLFMVRLQEIYGKNADKAFSSEPLIIEGPTKNDQNFIMPIAKNTTQIKEPSLRRQARISNEQNKCSFIMK